MIKVEVDGKERTKVIKLSLLLIGLEKHEKCISDFFEGRSNVKIFFRCFYVRSKIQQAGHTVKKVCEIL